MAAQGKHYFLSRPRRFGKSLFESRQALFAGQVFLFEFKVVELEPKDRSLQQIKAMHYADKYRSRCEPIHLIGIEFSKASRNIGGFEVGTL